ncbi:MAG: TolC family protein [Bacteroidales bacterium]|nr:TolC family protein [Bacteroidales bacterium]
MKKLRRAGVILTLFFPLLTYGQMEKTGFTLDEARHYAIEHNREIQNARDNITISDEVIKEARSQGLPQVSATLDFMTYFDYEIEFDLGMGSSSSPDLDYSVIDAGDQEILSMIEQMFSPTNSEPIVMKNQSNAKVQLNQLIFSGQYWVGLQTARIAKELSQKGLLKTELQVKETVTNTFYIILITEHSLNIINDNIKNIESIYNHTANMYNAGLAEKTDVDQLSINLSQLKNTSNSVKRNITLSYSMLKFQLGIEPSLNIVLNESLDEIMEKSDFESSILKELDINENVDYQLINGQVEIGEKQLALQKWAYSPTLVGFYSYTEKLQTTGLDMSPNHVAGLNLSIPIFSGGMRQSQLNQKKIELDVAKRNKSMVQDQLYLQEGNLKVNLNNAYENYQTQRDNVRIAKELYKSFENKYKQGILSSLDLTQAHASYLNAENSYTAAMFELLQAQLKIDILNTRL